MDAIFPHQYIERLVQTPHPGHHLLAVVLEDAVRAYGEHATARNRRDRALFRAVEAWFADDDLASPFAFLRIADELGIDPVWFRNVLARWRAYERALLDTPPIVRVDRLAS